jgi:MFS family permease
MSPGLAMTIHLLVLMCVLSHTGFGGSRVVMSLYALDQGATQFTIGILMALYAVCPLFLAVFVGRFADRIGPRVPMLIGIGGVVLGLLLPPLIPGVATLYLSALLLGSTFHFFFITVQGITGGLGGAESRSRNFALIGMGFSAAGFIGPFLAGLTIDHFGHMQAFLMLAAFPVPALLLLLFKPGFLPRARKLAGGTQRGSSVELLRVRSLRNTFIASGILSAAWDLFQFYFPVYGHSIGLSASAIGTVLGVFALATFTVRVAIPALAKRYNEAQVLIGAVFIAAVAFALFPLSGNAYVLGGFAFLLGLGVGCGQPVSMSLIYSLAPQGRAAECAGLRVTANNVMHLLIPLLFGSVGTAFGYTPVFLSNSSLLVAAGVMLRRARIGTT